MGGPSWLDGILAAIMIATAGYCASRPVIARAPRRACGDVDLMHTGMGVAMAGMLVNWLNPLPDRLWAGMFAVGAAWFGWRAWSGRRVRARAPGRSRPAHRHPVPHLVMCGAMVYMLLAVHAGKPGPAPGLAMGGPAAAGRFPLLALVLAVFMVGYVMWQADRLPAAARAVTLAGGTIPAPQAGTAPREAPASHVNGVATPDLAAIPGPGALPPRLTVCCQIATGVTMGYMLILML